MEVLAMNGIKKVLYLMFAAIVIQCSIQITDFFSDEYVLIVKVDTEADSMQNAEMIMKSLKSGGMVWLNVGICRELDPDFDRKYAVAGENGQFYGLPAILNFVASKGWKLQETVIAGTYLFRKREFRMNRRYTI